MQDKRDELYDNLIRSGKVSENEIGSRNEFKEAISDEATSRQFYKNLIGSGRLTTDEIGSEDDFYGSISSDFSKPTAQPAATPAVHPDQGYIFNESQLDSAGIKPTPEQRPIRQYNPNNPPSSAAAGAALGTISATPMTEEDKQRMMETVNDIGRQKRVVDYFAGEHLDNLGKVSKGLRVGNDGFGRVNIGESNNLTEAGQHLNMETGQLEKSYVTSAGNEYGSKEIADMEQRGIEQMKRDQRYYESLPGQIEDSKAEIERITNEIKAVEARFKEKKSKAIQPIGGVPVGGGVDWDANEMMTSTELPKLSAALRIAKKRLRALEAERDDEGQSMFWRGFYDTMMDPDVYTFGVSGLFDASEMLRLKRKVDEARAEGRDPAFTDADITLIRSIQNNQYAQSEFGKNRGSMYAFGSGFAQSVPFMLEIAATGGMKGLADVGFSAGKKMAAKTVEKAVEKTMIRNLGRGGEWVANAMVKGSGALGGVVGGGAIMANTTGAAKTSADIINRYVGQMTYDEDGQIRFEDGNSIGEAIVKGQLAQSFEYGSELIGDKYIEKYAPMLGDVAMKALQRMGPEKARMFLQQLASNKVVQGARRLANSRYMEKGEKMLNYAGVQGWFAEGMEEEANNILNAIFVGDVSWFKQNENTPAIFSTKDQLDLWGQVVLTSAILRAPQMTLTAGKSSGYYYYKHATDVYDAKAQSLFGADNWQMIKESIDNCQNQDLSTLLESVIQGSMSQEQKEATLWYAESLLKMRGYNAATMADANAATDEEAELNAWMDGIEQEYTQGHNVELPDEKKTIVDEAAAAAESLKQYGEEFAIMVQDEEENPSNLMDYLLSNRDAFTDEQIIGAADYLQKLARANGVMDAALDNVDLQVQMANAEVTYNTHAGSGLRIVAQSGDDTYYIIGGDVAVGENGIPELAGTAGAVVVRNTQTGEVSVKSPNDLSIISSDEARQLIWENENTYRQSLMQQANDEIAFGSPANETYEQEDVVTLSDGQGNNIDGQIVGPMAPDGRFPVQMGNGKMEYLTADDLNKMVLSHNGVEVKAAPATEEPAGEPAGDARSEATTENTETQGGTLDNAGGEAGAENGTGADNPPATALSRIPVKTDEQGRPMTNKKGRPVLEWHKASVTDATDALVETTGGNMLLARDTATDLVSDAKDKLEKIRKQKPKGEDPIEKAESRMEIQRQIDEQQKVVKQWQDVNQEIQKRMREESDRKQAELEAAKSAEQKAREAEAARQQKERQDEIARQRIQEQIERDREKRSREYEPLTQAKKEMASDADAMSVLNDTEPRDLEEWVSSLLSPHSILWLDASDSETGLQSELGLKRGDMQRFMHLLGTKESGAKPFGKVVLDIHEGLPEGLKSQYDDQDVRNVLLGLFQGSENSRQMMNLTAEHRIDEARATMRENERRAAEAEMDAWAEFYHLSPEERETFEDFMQQAPSETEQEIINQIIADNEQNRRSEQMDQQPVSGTDAAGAVSGEGQVQTAAQEQGGSDFAQGTVQAAEDTTGEPPVSDYDVSGRKYIDLRANLKYFVEQTGIATGDLIDNISNYEVDQLIMMIEDWEAELKANGSADELFEPIHQYVEGLQAKYAQVDTEGAIPTPSIDNPRYHALRQALVDAYRSGDAAAITKAAQAVQQYVDEGLDTDGIYSEEVDDYTGNDPEMLADQYMIHVFQDRYLDDDEDQEYIKTGLKPNMRQIAPSEQLKPTDLRDAIRPESAEIGVNEANARARYQLSATEKDAEGNAFYEKDGSIDLWSLPELFKKARRQNAPIRLTERNLQHIIDEHGKEIGDAEKVFEFLDDVFGNASVLRMARGRAMFVVVENEKTDKAAIIKLMPSETGDYYNVESAGYYRKNKWKNNEDVIADLSEPGQSDAAADVSKPQTPDDNGGETINAKTQASSSEGKVTDNSSNLQENQEKNSIQGLDGMTEEEVLDVLKNDIDDILQDNDLSETVAIKGIALHGSRLRGDARADSDLDVVVEYEGDISEDGLFNILNDAGLRMNGINIDINPITKGKSGTLEQYMERSRAYDEEKRTLGKTSTHDEIVAEEAKVNTNPSDAQKEAGNYQKGHINIDGYDITIENPKGSVRSGVDSKGNRWETTMRNTYGYIRGTEGVDGDHIDVFLSDEPTSGKVFVIDQIDDHSNFDEHKVMYGFASEEEARKAYLANYSKGWKGLGAITEVSREEFKKWVESSHRKTKPFAEYKSVKKEKQPKKERQHKRIVSDDQMEELRKQLLAKFGQVNVGLDMERMLIGAAYAVAKIERGVTKFADFCADMVEDFGDVIRPYLKLFYNGARDLPEASDLRPLMDDAATVEAFDVYNFDKGGKVPGVITKAQQVTEQQKVKKQAKKIEKETKQAIQKGVQQLNLFADMETNAPETETNAPETETNAPEIATKPAKQETPAKPQQTELRLRPATEADIDSHNPVYYYQGKRVYIVAVMRSGEQISATQFSKPKIDSIMLTNGKSVKLEDLQVEDKSAKKKEEPKRKTAWWNDPNRPQSLNPDDYKTYTTDEAKEYFAQFRSADGKVDFTKWAHPNLAYITAAAWDGADIPVEELMQIPEIIEAEKQLRSGSLTITDEEKEQLAHRLLDSHKGEVKQERKAFFIIGRPAGGKSSVFANPLSRDNSARIIDADDVKPWLEGYDGGNGAGYTQQASSDVMERALELAAENGENMVIPKIGGGSVAEMAAVLKLMGYDVQLYYNDVAPETSYMRSSSRFAQTGRYLSLDYLTGINDKPTRFFSKFAEKSIGDYLDERNQEELQNIRGRLARLHRELYASREGLWMLRSTERGGEETSDGAVQSSLGEGELQVGGNGVQVLLEEPVFSYAEWKSNDVGFGEKPKEIWNSKSGKPMPGTVNKGNNEGEQKVSGKPESVGQGAEQASGSTERTGTERSPEQNRAERSGSGHSVGQSSRVPKGEETRDTSGGPGRRSGDNARVSATTFHKNRRNNVGERGKDYAPLSPKARFNANVEAIKIMRLLVDEGIEVPTKDQMEALRQYSGWGGMGTFFNDETSAENKILRDLLSEEEYNDAALSIKTAYYTPATVIDTLWDLAKAAGFKGGNVLEGSAGIGNIIGQMPSEMSRHSDIEAVELDAISGNILRLLYPDAKVHIQGFQDTVIPNGSVDLAITNVPFAADISVIDKVDKDLSRQFRQLHDFCIAKNIRKLKEGGIGIFITTSGTLDKSTKLREWITDAGQTDVIGAFRLHNKTFGGTNVTSDIIVVRKRVNGQKSPNAIDISKATPLRVGTYEDKYHDEHQVSMIVNDYFKDHPEMMAGEMLFGYEKGDTYRPGSYGLFPVEGKNQEEMLGEFVKGIKEEVATESQQTERETVKNQFTVEKEGRMLIDDNGRLCVSERGVAVPLALNNTKVKGQTKEQCFKDYMEVQKAVEEVLQQQLSDPDDEALKPKLDALNRAFDKFVKRYGYLHKNTSIAFLRNDIDFPSFLALENYSESKDINGKVTVTTRKAPLFSQRVLGFKTEPQPKNIKDAVIASIFRSNGIDLEWIAERLNDVAAPPNGENWTVDDVRKGILVSRLGFEDPSTGQLEIRYKYLSGNVREKLAIAEAYNKPETDASGTVAGKYAANIEELRKAVPMDIPSHLIEFSLGSSWIPMEIYNDFLKETFDLDGAKLTHLEGSWVLDEGYGYRNEKNRAAGVYSEQFSETIYGHQLVLAALNNRPVKVQKQVSEGYGSSKTTRTVTDQAATQACAVRVDEIKDEFKQFAKKKMQDNPELAARVEKIYNEKFNALVPMQIDDEFLPDVFEGANMNIHLYGHQKRGVMRGLTSPTMLAHEVGTGKSFTLISTAMEMKRLGTAKKPMIVVQNATVAQMTADAKLLYPNARVLSLSEKDRSAEGRRSFYAKIKYNDWDLIIIPQSTFERIPDSPERELQFIQEKIDEKKHVIEAAEQSGMDSREIERLRRELEKMEQEYGDTYLDRSDEMIADKKRKKDAKQEAASLEKAKVKAQEQLDRAVDDVQYFDDLGVDALLIDEAHEYKHLGFQTSIGRGIKGIDPSYSKKCAGLYNKTRSVFEKAGWKNVVFATGTPISNTAAEIWTFMKYLMPADVMKANDIYYFDDFVHNFGSISQMLEFATNGKFKENTRFAAYVNKPELIRIWSQVADTVLTKEVGAVNEKIPEQEGGKDQDVFLPQSPSLIRIMNAVRKELERFENMSGKEKKENSSIPLTMYGIAKRAAIDPRLVDAEAPDEPMSKTNAAVKEILKDLEATKDYKGTVAVFCDNQNRLGRRGGKVVVEFNIYDDMKAKLIKAGVPESQIAIIKSGMSITAKQKVFDAVNSGDIRVVLGSTQTLGTGVNMQERLHLLIHMDAPDRPMDYTQRNGRIKRQGNLHKIWGKTIRVLRFGVEDSLDVTAYQRLKTKSGFIDSIMDGKGALLNNQVDRTVEEEEEGLFDNPVAVLSGSQFALKKNQAERELRKYQGKKAQWEADQVYVSNALRQNKATLANTQSLIAEEEKQLARIRSLFPNGTVGTIIVEGVKVDMSSGNAAAYGELMKVIKEKINDPVNATVKKLRENQIYNDEVMNFTIELDGHKVNFKVSVEREAMYENGKMRTVVHKYTTYDCPTLGIDTLMKSSKSVGDQLNDILDEVVSGRDNTDRIEAYKAKIERINRENEQLQQRVGMEFQFDKELEQARKNVEEYTELMKQEMKEKEAKYAAQQEEAGDGGFDLHKAEDSEEEDEDVRYSAAEDDLDEEEIIIAQAKANGTYMRAPNGNPSNLSEEQWAQVRTQAFKDWFGDWENDPENASQVVDENGEPKVMYHGTNLHFVNHDEPFWVFRPDSHFGTKGQAEERMGLPDTQAKNLKLYAVFLNIRNAQRRADADQEYLEEKDMTMSEYWEQCASRAKYNGYDGIVYLNEYEDIEHPADSWITFRPEQVKSADGNVGTFDPTNPDIRHRETERFAEGQTFPIRTDGTTYTTDLMPDLYDSEQQLLDALRRQYPEYWISQESDRVRFESWQHALNGSEAAMRNRSTKEEKARRNYIERKIRNAVNAVTEMASRMGLDVEILTTTEGLKDKDARSKGWFNPKTGKITLVLPNNANLSDLINTLLHEGVAHYGLRKMFGSSFDTFLDNIYNNVSQEIRAIIDASMKRNKWSQHEATEEYLARLAERTDFEHATQQGWWKKIKDFFIGMLAKVGFNVSLSDNDLRYILWRSHENLIHPDRYRNVFDNAREVAMQARLQVGRFAMERERLQRTGRIDTSRIAVASETSDADLLHSIRKKEPPKKTGIGYKVFVLKDGQLYPPMVANPGGEGTPVGVWLDADAAPIVGKTKTGRSQVKAGGKGTQGGSGQLSYRPGWHLGEIPYALQFNRKDSNGERTLFPNNFVWAEVEYADDVNYQEEARQEGINANGNYQHSLAGLKHVPTDGSYKYRTNPDPRTDEWIITGAMRVNKILSREEVADLVRQAGREPQPIQDGDIVTQETVDALNAEIKATKEADEMGLLYRSDDDDIAKDIYEDFVAKDSFKFKENWQDSMASLKAIQKAIAAETGRVATGAEDAYRFENRMHGRAKNMTEKYDYNFYRPMLKAFHEFCKYCHMSIEHGMDYLISKSGLERNVYYAFRDAAKAKITDEINEERKSLEKQYSKGRMSEEDYKAKRQELEEREQNGVDDFMKQVRAIFPYRHAKQQYENGDISYTEYLHIIETVIHGQLMRKKPKKDADGNIVSSNYYDDQQKDYSGLTETFAKDMYDEAQSVKKRAQRAIDPDERKALWHEYDEKMRQAYITAREVAEDQVFAAEQYGSDPAVTHQHTKRLWDFINAATKETLRHSYESGLIDRTNYYKVRDMFDWYIPLRGWEEDKAADVYTYMGKDNVFSPAVKKVWGRQSKAENPLAYIGNIAVSTILSGHRNLLKQHFLNYVMNNPTSLVSISESWYENIAADGDAPVWILRTADTAGKDPDEIAQIVNDFNEEMRLKQNEGKAMPVRGRLRLDVHATSGQKAEHVVEVQRAGHTYQLYINGDPKAAQALNGSAARAVSRISDTWLGKKITKINRDMAAFFTSKNPAFVVSNLSRDLNMAGASVAINEGKEYNARFIANVAKVLRPRLGESSKWVPASKQPTGLMPSLMRKWLNGSLNLHDETERLFGEFMDEGGETGFVNMLSIDSFKERMQKEIREMNGSSLFGAKAKIKECSTRKALRLLGETFEFYNRCAEDATRFIVYMTSRQMGKTLEESIADAKDVTLNFNRKGTGGMGNAEVRDLFIFVNPAIQALANMYRMAAHHPLKFGAVTAAFVAGGALMPIINQWFLNMWGDDDDKHAYWNLPPWVRKNNLVMWIPFTKNFITIPLAQEFRVFYGVGEMMSSAIMDHSVDKWGLEVFSSVADLVPINPTGNGGNLMVDLAPTMVQPLIQVGENVDFTGKPIWRENQGNKHAPMYSKAYVSTPTWMVKVSEGLNEITGGNEGRKGWVERNAPVWGDYINNPAVWNHLLQGYFGGMYNTIAKTADVVTTTASGELPKIYQTPVINRFLNRPVERDNGGALGEEYYSLINERDEVQYEVRTWKRKASEGDVEAQKKLDELMQSERYRRAEVISHYEKILKDLKAGERAIKEGATHGDNDLHDIHASMDLYKAEMLEELAAISEGRMSIDAAIEKFDNAKSLAEKNKLRLRIERLMMEDANGKKVSRSSDVEKAVAYLRGEEVESRNTTEQYLMLATGEDMVADARIRAAKARIKQMTDEYKKMISDGRTDEAATYREKHAKWFAAENIINGQQRGIATNKKLLGKGYDANIMKLIRTQRQRMLDAIKELE